MKWQPIGWMYLLFAQAVLCFMVACLLGVSGYDLAAQVVTGASCVLSGALAIIMGRAMDRIGKEPPQ